MSSIAAFINKNIAEVHQGGDESSRPWRRAFQQLLGTGLVVLAALGGTAQQANAWTGALTGNLAPLSGPLGGTMYQQMHRAAYIAANEDDATLVNKGASISWEDQQRSDARRLQAKESGIDLEAGERMTFDEAKVEQYLADRIKERDAKADVE